MNKYIKAEELKEVFRDTEDAEYTRWTLAGVIGEIDDIEAADVQEVQHGKWEMKEDPYGFFDTIPVCSVCGCTTKYRVTSAYCPHCGAKMDGDTE